ncbi:hypothetical protein E1162_10335 [Rhodobacteraceae bacterium RKSG542]|uniref:hypothetical protein n=1 Tax=Pseudovibrio flavus TaxID=2529854 RepID=UPI0012BD4E2E|nr:hypothetical protein [Pseudovibrio flavus]MTI17637.1 hypothetical protein [Pseudovibrio flavus]
MLSEEEVISFYRTQPSNLNTATLENVLQRYNDAKQNYEQCPNVSGINFIKDHNNLNGFDMAFLDGCDFTGRGELEQVWGAKVIALNGTESIRAMDIHQRLMDSRFYKLCAYDPTLGDGYAIYEHRRFNAH